MKCPINPRTGKEWTMEDEYSKHTSIHQGTTPEPPEEDLVNSPSHYQLDGFEVIDIIKALLTPEEYRGFLKGNDLKYIFREPHKGNPAQDVGKHIWYAQRYHDALLEEGKQ